ncbi:MAG: methyltransferase domain-containing protein [Candidatus Taylorbacteria bacterium]
MNKQDNKNPLVSVIIPTINPAPMLEPCLQSILKQTYKNIEIIILIPKEERGFIELSEKYNFRIIYCASGKNFSRNVGAQAARGEYLIHIDDDMRLSPGVVEECVSLSSGDVYKAIAIHETKERSVGLHNKLRILEKEIVSYDKYIEAPRFIKKDIYEKVGGICVDLDPIDEGDLKAKLEEAGISYVTINSTIVISSKSRRTYFRSRWHHMYTRGQKMPLFNTLHPRSSQLKPFKRIKPYVQKIGLLVKNPFTGICLVFVKALDLLFLHIGAMNITLKDKEKIVVIKNKLIFENEARSYQKEFYEDTCGAKYVDEKEKKIVIKYLEGLDRQSNMKILDIGPGGGRWSELLLAYFPKSEVFACDLSHGMINGLEQRFRGEVLFKAKVGDMQDLPFEDNSFDLVVSIRAIKYAVDQKKVFSEISRVLKPGGKGIIELPYLNIAYRFVRSFRIFNKISDYVSRIVLSENDEIKQNLENAYLRPKYFDIFFTVPATFYKNIATKSLLVVSNTVDSILPKMFFGRSIFICLENDKPNDKPLLRNNLFSIIITTKNRYNMLMDELVCLTEQVYKNFKVYIVDDNSSDQTKDIDIRAFKQHFDVEIHRNMQTLNMIGSRNIGLGLADKRSDYFMILDDDNKFDPDFLDRFNRLLNKYPGFGIVGPKNYHIDKKSIWYFGCDYNLSTLFPHLGKKEFADDILVVDSVANCFVIKRELLKDIGLFDEKYVIDFSETEYSYRAKAVGYKTCVANVPIYHQATTGKEKLEMFTKRIETRPETYFYTFRNKYLFISEFGNIWNKILFYFIFQFVTLVGYVYIATKVRKIKLLGLYLKGFWAGNIYLFTGKLVEYDFAKTDTSAHGGAIQCNADAYDKVYKIYNLKHSEIYNSIEQDRLRKVIADLVKSKNIPNINVLDVGAGTGNLTLKFLDLSCKATALDVSANSLALLKQLSNNNKNLETVILTDNKLPFADETFDITATYSVLHHIPDYLFTVGEMIRVTKKGGLIYIDHEHNENKWFPKQDLKEYYDINKYNKFDYLRIFYKNGELFTLGFIKEAFIRTFINKKYQKEGDIHVWVDDHIDWRKIEDIAHEKGCKIIKNEDYLLYRPEVGLAMYSKFKDKSDDMRYIIIQK